MQCEWRILKNISILFTDFESDDLDTLPNDSDEEIDDSDPLFYDNTTNFASPNTSDGDRTIRQIIPNVIPDAFKKNMFWPIETPPKNRKSKENIPSVTTSAQWQQYFLDKEHEKQQKEKLKRERMEQRKTKKSERERMIDENKRRKAEAVKAKEAKRIEVAEAKKKKETEKRK